MWKDSEVPRAHLINATWAVPLLFFLVLPSWSCGPPSPVVAVPPHDHERIVKDDYAVEIEEAAIQPNPPPPHVVHSIMFDAAGNTRLRVRDDDVSVTAESARFDVERATFSGKVGIGTQAPHYALDVITDGQSYEDPFPAAAAGMGLVIRNSDRTRGAGMGTSDTAGSAGFGAAVGGGKFFSVHTKDNSLYVQVHLEQMQGLSVLDTAGTPTGIVLRDPDGDCRRLEVDGDGTVAAPVVACPQ